MCARLSKTAGAGQGTWREASKDALNSTRDNAFGLFGGAACGVSGQGGTAAETGTRTTARSTADYRAANDKGGAAA